VLAGEALLMATTVIKIHDTIANFDLSTIQLCLTVWHNSISNRFYAYTDDVSSIVAGSNRRV